MKITSLKKNQSGVVLVISLIMLLMLTLLATSSMQNTVLEEKMAGNFKEVNTAFEAAEAALRDGEAYLAKTTPLPIFDGTTLGLYQPTTTGISRWEVVDWSNSAQVVAYTGNLGNLSAQPSYIIEEMMPFTENGSSLEAGTALETRYYRVTSDAVGGTASTNVRLQSIYKK